MQPELIFWPMILLALVTLYVYIPMSRARVASVKSGKTKARTYKLNQEEPEESLRFSNALRNQYESPILFYAVCISAFVTGHASTAMVLLAWAFALLKTAHVIVHITTNNLRHRRPLFMLAFLTLGLMWLTFATHLLGLF